LARVTLATLQVQLEAELPGEVAVGGGTALFVCGWCFCPHAQITSLEFVLDGRSQPVDSLAMPRLDPFRALHPGLDPLATGDLERDPESSGDPELRSYRSGFWGLVRIDGPPAAGAYQLALKAGCDTGETVVAELGRIAAAPPVRPLAIDWPAPVPVPAPAPAPAPAPVPVPGAQAQAQPVAIAMATYNPPADLLARQLDSIRAQTHRDWICVISDDCSRPAHYAAIEAAIAGDSRFHLSRSSRRLGFYRNFERALALVPTGARYVAMADQDDDWRPDKLARLLAAIADAQLVYSDARVVSRDGGVISETWWDHRRNNHADLLSLLVANSVTGAASLIRRELLDWALPFPPAQFHHYHDHWVGLVALSLGEIAFVPEPLYDYVQHGEASLGHAAANRMTSLRDRLVHRRDLRERVHMWRLHYFVDIWRLRQFAAVLLLRAGGRMSPGKRRILERFLAADDSLTSLFALGARGARELLRRTPETLGAEWALFHALGWRRLLDISARPRPQRRLRLDALPPPSLIQEPGRAELDESVAAITRKREPLRWTVVDDAPCRVNLLIPTVDLQHFFGGYIAKFNLARRLAQRGLRVRIVTVDPTGALPADWRRRVESFAELEGLFDTVEMAFGRESAAIECSRRDGFIATTWWTAHIARAALDEVQADRFVYLIQEYEPFTFPMGTYAALAAESYTHRHFAVFSSELLRGYFRAHSVGVYAQGARYGDQDSLAFQNAITRVAPVGEAELAARSTRRLLFYARPEPHAARNMFELGVLGLAQAVRDGVFEGGWELNGIGSVRGASRIALGGRAAVRLLPRSDQASYAELLRDHDVGLALMYTPHPSLVPLEMASAGMLTVTNHFENKTPDALAAISSNLLTVAPTAAGVAGGLRAAVQGVADVGRRSAGADVRWSTQWTQSFPDEMLDRIIAVLGVPAG
jgi:glycosyltransferase involved in cell wall biosynthesis